MRIKCLLELLAIPPSQVDIGVGNGTIRLENQTCHIILHNRHQTKRLFGSIQGQNVVVLDCELRADELAAFPTVLIDSPYRLLQELRGLYEGGDTHRGGNAMFSPALAKIHNLTVVISNVSVFYWRLRAGWIYPPIAPHTQTAPAQAAEQTDQTTGQTNQTDQTTDQSTDQTTDQSTDQTNETDQTNKATNRSTDQTTRTDQTDQTDQTTQITNLPKGHTSPSALVNRTNSFLTLRAKTLSATQLRAPERSRLSVAGAHAGAHPLESAHARSDTLLTPYSLTTYYAKVAELVQDIKTKYRCNVVVTSWGSDFERGYNYRGKKDPESEKVKGLAAASFLPSRYYEGMDRIVQYNGEIYR